jgi:hypothetical protein
MLKRLRLLLTALRKEFMFAQDAFVQVRLKEHKLKNKNRLYGGFIFLQN